jgi:hypothetical protein
MKGRMPPFIIGWFIGLSRHEATCAQAQAIASTAARQHPKGQESAQEGGRLREAEALKPQRQST